MIKFNWKKSFLILISLSLFACSDFPKEIKPTVLDIQLQEARQYKIVRTNPLTVEFEKSISLQLTDGYVCLSQQDYILIKQYLESRQK